MKNSRTIILLLFAVCLLAFAHYALRRYGGESVRTMRRSTLVDVGRRFDAIEIGHRGGASMRLARSPDWRIVAPYAGSADEHVVMRLLDALALTPVDDVITDVEMLRNGSVLADFQLDDPETTIVLSGDGDDVKVMFGRRTAAGSCVYAALSGSGAVYAMPTGICSAVSVSAESFRRRSLFLSGDATVESFQIRRSVGGVQSFVRDGDLWRVGGASASIRKVEGLLAELQSAEAVDFVWPTGGSNELSAASSALLSTYGLDSDSAVTITLHGFDGEDRRVVFGAEAKESLVYALVQNGTAVVTVPSKVRELAMSRPEEFTDARLFPLGAESVTAFRLSYGNEHYVIARDSDGGWRLDAPISAPADAEISMVLLNRILALSTVDLRPDGLRVTVQTNSAPVSVAPERVMDGYRFCDLRSREVLKIDQQLVRRLVATRGGRQSGYSDAVVFDRERSAWLVEKSAKGGTADVDGVSAVLTALNSLKALRVEKLKVDVEDLAHYGLTEPFFSLSIDIDRKDAVRRNIVIGDATDGGRFATVGSLDAVFVLSSEVLKALMNPLVTD